MKLVYVFDTREATGCEFRAPEWVAWLFCHMFGQYDYDYTVPDPI